MTAPSRPALLAPDLTALADRCVQCGLCLPACPTYRLDALETESPRGRIALAKAWAQETVAPTAAGDAHLDHCLGCRRCEAVCPAGVEYDALLVAARDAQRRRRPPGWRQRAAEALTARPALLQRLLGLYRIAHPWLPNRLRRLPRPPASPASARPAAPSARMGEDTVAVFVGCVARTYEAPARDALARLCAAVGATPVDVAGQTCCGTLHAHAGDTAAAQVLGERNRAAFVDAGTVLTLASGCHAAVADALGRRTVDALDFLAARAEHLRFGARPMRVALHLPCTQRNTVGSDIALRALLKRVPGLDVVVLDAGYGCCGAAGSAMLTDPERAARFRQPLLDAIAATNADCVLSANIGCRLHLENGTALPVRHPLEFLAECLE